MSEKWVAAPGLQLCLNTGRIRGGGKTIALWPTLLGSSLATNNNKSLVHIINHYNKIILYMLCQLPSLTA